MNTFSEAHELEKARSRVLRLYGQQKITKAQHDAALDLLHTLGIVLSDPNAAEQINQLAKVGQNGTHASSN